MLNLPVPEVEYHNIAVKPSQVQKELVASLGERAEKIRGGHVDSSVDNMTVSYTHLDVYKRQLQYGTLEKMGLIHFDAWASTFGETVTRCV